MVAATYCCAQRQSSLTEHLPAQGQYAYIDSMKMRIPKLFVLDRKARIESEHWFIAGIVISVILFVAALSVAISREEWLWSFGTIPFIWLILSSFTYRVSWVTLFSFGVLAIVVLILVAMGFLM